MDRSAPPVRAIARPLRIFAVNSDL